MRLDSFLEQSAVRTPGKTALVCGSARVTYAELDAASDRLAAGLRTLGVQRGDRVAIFLENGPEAVIAIFGALKADAVFVMINASTKASKLALLLGDCRAAALVTDGRRWSMAADLCGALPSLRAAVVADPRGLDPKDAAVVTVALDTLLADTLLADTPLADTPPADTPPVDTPPVDRVEKPAKRSIDLDLAALMYTSGSSGRPKGVMLTHRNMVTAAQSITSYLGSRQDDVVLNVLPLSFDYGLYQVLMTILVGGTIVLERSFTYVHAVLETMARERVTGFPVVPTIAALLLQVDLTKYDFSALRYVTSTGAAMPVAHLAELRRLLPAVRIFSMYGLTECKRVSYLPPEELDSRPGSVGRGMPNEEVFVVDDEGRPLTSGVGELVVRGSNVMSGYWEQPEETARMLRPGWIPGELFLYTGDTFRRDEDGYLYFVARRDDIIKTRGEKVSPREVEDVLHRLPGIAEAAVLGVSDPILGQSIKAVVTLRPGALLSEQEIQRHCGAHLDDFMVPHAVEIRDALPRTANGKRDYAALEVAC